ncbi:hypothetical protein [Klebsiella aerogenes]
MINKRIASLIAGVLVVSAIQPIAGLMGSNRCYIFDISHFYTYQKAKEYSAKTIDAATKGDKVAMCDNYKEADFYSRMGGDQSGHDKSDKDIAELMKMCGMG